MNCNPAASLSSNKVLLTFLLSLSPGVEVAKRFAYYGVSTNLITYLTRPLGQSTASAAENVNAWSGMASLLLFVGGFIADAFLSRYLTIIIDSLLYILALALLAFSSLLPFDCENVVGSSSCSPQLQVILFFVSLYLVAFAQGGHRPCVQAFGADQETILVGFICNWGLNKHKHAPVVTKNFTTEMKLHCYGDKRKSKDLDNDHAVMSGKWRDLKQAANFRANKKMRFLMKPQKWFKEATSSSMLP